MSDVVMDVEGTGAVAGDLPRQLYEQGLYHQAWQAAEAAWGPLAQWCTRSDAVLGSRILAQVGLFRSSAALVLRLWRRAAAPDGDLQYAYVLARLNLDGPYIARREWLRFSTDGMSAEERGWWLALGSIIHCCFRDWEQAQACLDAARGEGIALDIEQSWLWEQQDRYDDALTLLQDMQPENGNQERLCLQGRARLLELIGQRDQAMALLAAGLERFESVEIGMRLHYMQRNDGLLDAADATLARVRSWLPARGSALNHDVAIAQAEVLYRRGDMDAALEALSGARGYFFRQVRATLAECRHSGVHRQLDVPFIRQHHMTCAPATLTAVWRYHGHDIDHLTLAEAICYDGTSDLAERRWIEEQGWAVREFELNLDDIRLLIDAGCPVGLSTVEPGSAHMQAVIGYDTRKGIYLLRDPYYPGTQELLIDGAHDAYAASGPRCIVAVPPARRDWLQGLPLRHAALYDDYFRLQQALQRNDRAAAEQAALALEQQAPGHRLTLWARRSLARYDDDSLRVLECTEALLQLFPQDLNLLVAKAQLLGELGRESEHLQFLEETCRGSQNHPFLLRALATQMAKDGRRQDETRRVLHAILKQQPMNDSAWWSLAGLLWDQQAREDAFDCYRLCLCLQDKVEDYAIAYFKAARFLRRGEEALAYLQRRIDWLGNRSANPYISYMRALDLLDRTPEALAVVEQALLRHGDDAWLVAEAFDYFCNSGNPERARELLQHKGQLLAEVLRDYKEIRLLQMAGDRAGELAAYQRILALQPRNENAAANVARLLADAESPDAAIAFLDAKLAEKPQNLWLLKEKLRYVQRLPVDRRSVLLADILARRPDDARLASAQAALWRKQGRHADALALMLAAREREPAEHWLQMEVGDIHLEMGDVAAARAAYENAIRIFIDADGVFERLLSCHASFEGKQKVLKFIHAELMRQVSLGNGILEFQGLARRYLPDNEVGHFLEEAVRLRPDLWQSWAGLGGFQRETNQLETALATFEEACRRFPLLPRLHLDRAEIARLQGNFEAAESGIRTALAINPAYSLAVTKLADILELRSDLAGALAVIERGLQASPRYIPYYGYLADLQSRLSNRPAALATLRQALRIDHNYPWAWEKLRQWSALEQDSASVEALASKLLEEFPDSATLWLQSAKVFSDSKRRHECLQRAFELAPHENEALLARCDLLVEEGAIHEARALLARAREADTANSEIRTYRAWLDERTGARDAAIQQLEVVVADDPAHYNAWRLLAQWHDEGGRGDDCCRCVRQCVLLYPLNAAVLGMAADMLLRHARDGSEVARRLEAREYLVRAIHQDHTNSYSVLTLADLYLDEGDLDDCEQLLARQLISSDNYVRARLLRLALLRGDTGTALGHYRHLLCHPVENNWLLVTPFTWFKEKGQKQATWEMLRELAADVATPPLAARAWMHCLLSDDAAARPVADALKAIAGNTAFWREAVLHALRGAAQPQQLSILFWEDNPRFRQDGELWSAVIAFQVRQDAWAAVRAMSPRKKPCPTGATARALYQVGVAWRMAGQWQHGQALMQKAGSLTADDSRCSLLLWAQADLGFQDARQVDTALLAGLPRDELSPVEQMLRDVLLVLHDWRVQGSSTLAARLRELWPQYQKYLQADLTRRARRQVFHAIIRQFPGGRLQAWWTAWRSLQPATPP